MATPNPAYIRGTIATTDRLDSVHPGEWNGNVYEYMPIGHIPFTGILDAMESKVATSKKIWWYDEPFPKQLGTCNNVTTDSGGTAYATGGVEEDKLFFWTSVEDEN